MTDRYTKLTKDVPTSSTRATTIARIFIEHRVSNNGFSSKVLTNNGPLFSSKPFTSVCTTLGVNNLATAEYHPQTDSQEERFNSALISTTRHRAAKQQSDWDTFFLPLIYTYNVQVHKLINITPFSLALTQTPSGPSIVATTLTSFSTEDNVRSAVWERLQLNQRTALLRE